MHVLARRSDRRQSRAAAVFGVDAHVTTRPGSDTPHLILVRGRGPKNVRGSK